MNTSKNHYKIIIVLGIIFFFIYSFLVFNHQGRFNSPDETANYFFINNFNEQNDFTFYEPLNEITDNIVKPRSFNVYNNNLVPGSFLGFPLIYGLIGKIIGSRLVLFLTPLLAAAAGLFFYKILLKCFSKKIAFLSALFFFINPVWWYFASLSMMPNVAFVSLLIIGFYFLLEFKEKSILNKRNLILAGLFVGLALIIRTNEIVWVGLVLLILILNSFYKIKKQHILWFALSLILVFVPVLFYNHFTFGNFLSFGYFSLEQGTNIIDQVPQELQISQLPVLNFLKSIFLPFGFHPRLFSLNFFTYVIKLFWWMFVPAFLGLIISLLKYKEKRHLYIYIYLLITAYLIVYYGSWLIPDPLTLHLNKISVSYLRYWLPIFIFGLPFISIFFIKIISWLKPKKLKIGFSFLLIFSYLYLIFNILFIAGNDNLVATKKSYIQYREINQKVLELTEDNAVIISQKADKLFFPERKVIGSWTEQDFADWRKIAEEDYPIYYYSYENSDYIAQFNQQLLANNLVLAQKKHIINNEYLYQIFYFQQ